LNIDQYTNATMQFRSTDIISRYYQPFVNIDRGLKKERRSVSSQIVIKLKIAWSKLLLDNYIYSCCVVVSFLGCFSAIFRYISCKTMNSSIRSGKRNIGITLNCQFLFGECKIRIYSMFCLLISHIIQYFSFLAQSVVPFLSTKYFKYF